MSCARNGAIPPIELRPSKVARFDAKLITKQATKRHHSGPVRRLLSKTKIFESEKLINNPTEKPMTFEPIEETPIFRHMYIAERLTTAFKHPATR